MVAAAVIGGAVVGAAATTYSSNKASKAQSQAAAASNDTQRYMYDQTREDNMPALQSRNASLARMQELLGIGGNKSAAGYGSLGKTITAADVQNEAGYQFGLDQGLGALNKQAAARGMLNSGAALKAATRYGTDYATTKTDNAFNRLQSQENNTFNRLASVAGAGQVGANTISNAGSNYANNVSSTQQGLGNALAASQIAQGNAWSDAANGVAGWYAYQNRPKS